jgi:hypothetical protein
METKTVEKMEIWLDLKQMIIEKGYTLWQTQYDWDEPEGLIVGFMKDDKRLEVTTHNEEIEDDIFKSAMWRKRPPE